MGDQGADDRVAGSDTLAAEVAAAFGLPIPAGWQDLGGSSTTNLQLNFDGRDPVVARIHRRYTSPDRLGAIQTARRVVCAVGVPAVEPISAPDGSSSVELSNRRLVELEPLIRWNDWMNTVPLLEIGFGLLARIHDALRMAEIPAAGRTAVTANHIDSAEALSATRRGAERIRGWNDLVLSRFADRVCRHVEAVDAAEAPLRDRQVVQVVHGDFWHNNVLFQDREIAAVLDFDFMGERPRIDDLALTLYFYLLKVENSGGLPTAADRVQIRRFVDAYDAATTLPLSSEERAALPLAIARQPAWSIGRWVNDLDEPRAKEHAKDVVGELPVAQAVLAELPAWQEALLDD